MIKLIITILVIFSEKQFFLEIQKEVCVSYRYRQPLEKH
jgi:hypothetical protein